MLIGLKDGIKLIGISIVCAAAVFVCTFMLNFYIDVQTVEQSVTEQMRALYDAQISMCKFVTAITGVVLGVITAVMLAFYIKLYVDANAENIGIIKAFGYSDASIAIRFWVFGLSVLIGTAAGFGLSFAAMPAVYRELTIDGLLDIAIRFHFSVFASLVIAPTAVFTALACGYALHALKRPVNELLRGKTDKPTKVGRSRSKDRPFLIDMGLSVLGAKKSVVFFFTFACFCFSSMIQMGVSMSDMNSDMMGMIILVIGITLASVTTVMSVTTLVNANKKNVALMRAFGYRLRDCVFTVFAGYVPFGLIGFAAGTAYQYGLLKLMIGLMFDDVAGIPEYTFDLGNFFIVLAVFIATYAVVFWVYSYKLKRTFVNALMAE